MLFYDRIFLLSGTFVSNKWYDLYRPFDFFPNHPFKSRTRFLKAFGRKDASGTYLEPTPSKRNRLAKLLQAFMVSQPATLLNLKILENSTLTFTLPTSLINLGLHSTPKSLWISLKKGTRSEIYAGDLSMNDAKSAAVFHAIRAEQYRANSCLIYGLEITTEDGIRS